MWFLSKMRGRRCISSWLSGWRCLEGDKDSFQLCSAAFGGEENKVNSPFSTAQQQAQGLAWQLCENVMQPFSPHADEKSTPIWSSSLLFSWSTEWVSVRTQRCSIISCISQVLPVEGAATLENAALEVASLNSSCEFRDKSLTGQVVRPLSIPAADPFGTCATGNGQAIRWIHHWMDGFFWCFWPTKIPGDLKQTFFVIENLLGQVSKWCCFNIMLERSGAFKPVYYSFESEALGEWFASQNWLSFCRNWRGSFLERGCPSLSAQVFVDFFFLRYPSGETEMWLTRAVFLGASQIVIFAMTFVKAKGVFCKLTLKLMRLRGQYLPEARCKISFCKALRGQPKKRPT